MFPDKMQKSELRGHGFGDPQRGIVKFGLYASGFRVMDRGALE